jgi:flagellar biosynthesis chaperone FliJ
MIKTQEDYDVVYQQLQRILTAYEALRSRLESKNKRNFEIFSEGYDEQIEELRRELDTYQGPHIHRSSPVVGSQSPNGIANTESVATAGEQSRSYLI